ncbi:isoaspartyl peptidase/L-asparaginase [Cryomorpha ignava]|uniref:Isoaspartyl peptidase n=1 Tax=Cryomorpha ignava TaxID=101383 RepID=A0A7K3WUE9_9FLAO|nr:isoaspartyl peptidase/L-asparaginase [Cryomorpha ignava]NEN24522.1 isoaspartyl peptidase/L-asparaginase [Cryomorpha ignava]
MKLTFSLIFVLFALSGNVFGQTINRPAIVIHGGAGTIERHLLSDSLETIIRTALQDALNAGYAVLENGGTAVDAVEATITLLENCPEFNAGKGAVMTDVGTHELDASIMDGSDLNAGAVAGVKTVKSPILAARTVMVRSPHVMLAGEGAEEFAKQEGLEMVDNTYFTTPRIQKRWDESHKGEGSNVPKSKFSKFGTVGCVALDKDGNIAAGTSTGGMMNKKYGRIGDSPIIGAGTYADNETCGVSCTGHGEYFIRIGVAKEISDQMKFGKKTLKEAAEYTVNEHLSGMNAQGGIIAMDKDGNFELVFNTPGMYRGYKNATDEKVMIYGDE